MSTRIGVVVPVRNCLEYTKAALASLRTRHEYRTYVIDDHSDEKTKDWLAGQSQICVFTDPPGSTGLAWNWNLGISAAIVDGCTHVLVINNDVLLHADTVDALVDRIDRGDVVLVTGDDIAPRAKTPEDVYDWTPDPAADSHHLDYSCYMLVPETLRRVGWFDEEFVGAYYEDNDYTARMVRAGLRGARVGAAPYYHYSMRTVNNNPETKPAIQRCAGMNGERFQRKWSRLPAGSVEEMLETYYAAPFNGAVCGVNDPTMRFQEMYGQDRDVADRKSPHSDPLYRLASTLNSVTVVGDIGLDGLCALMCAGVRRLCFVGRLEPAAQARIAGAAVVHGLPFERVDDYATARGQQRADLVAFGSWFAREYPGLVGADLRTASRFVAVVGCSVSLSRSGCEIVGQWATVAACTRECSEFRLHPQSGQRLVMFRRYTSRF